MSWLKKVRSSIYLTKDEQEFRHWMHMANRHPNVNSTYKFDVAWAYARGHGVDQNLNEALSWFEKTANCCDIYKDGSPSGSHELFFWYFYGRNRCVPELVIPVDYKMAAYWGERYMVSSTHVSPVYVLMALIYQRGMQGVPRDKHKASRIYRFLGHLDTWPGRKFRVGACDYFPEAEGFTRDKARQQVWELETGEEGHRAPEHFMEDDMWHRRPAGECRRNKNGHVNYESYDLWGPDLR